MKRKKSKRGLMKVSHNKVKKKHQKISTLKKKLDSVFSKFTRYKYSDDNGNVVCYTCGKIGVVKTMQCGHFVSRQYLATRWDEDNVRVQCWGCNGFGNGRLLDFEEKLVKELSKDKVEELKMKRHKIVKLDVKWYNEHIQCYEEKLKQIT